MQAPVELRVHGVGGSTPEALLGVPSPAQTVRVAGGPVSAFYRRRNHSPDEPIVEAYCWGGLTTQSTLQPLWLFLLPLTLHNVAGWMHRGPRGRGLEPVIRWTIRLLGYALTAAWSLWTVVLLLEVLAWAWLARVTSWPAGVRLAVGSAGVLAVLVGLGFVARHFTHDFEHFRPPHRDGHVRADRTQPNLPEDPCFWDQSPWADRALKEHAGVALLTAAGAIVLAVSRAGVDGTQWLGVGRLLVPLIALQLLGLAVLALCSILEGAQRLRQDGAGPRAAFPDGLRGIGPFGAAALAVGMSYGTFGGIAVFLGSRLGLEGITARPEQVAADVVGLAAIALGVGIALVVAGHTLIPAGLSDVPAVAPPRPGTPLRGIPNEGWRRRVARRRKFAQLLGNVGWALAPPSALFLVAGIGKLIPHPDGRVESLGALLTGSLDPEPCPSSGPGQLVAWLTSACGGPSVEPTWLASAGTWIVGLVITIGLPYLWRAARSPRLRASVGVVWDILTFWPRWHYPFAVRCYAERAVPEIAHRIVRLVHDEDRDVVLSVHSQGTVLALAAVLALHPGIARRVGIVTFGSPLSNLYGRFYPAYFGRDRDFSTVVDDDDGWRVASWRNLYRKTDYIGRTVRGLPEGDQTVVPDPSQDADDERRPVPAWTDEAPRVPWTSLAGHSHYRAEPLVRAAVRDALDRARAGRATANGDRSPVPGGQGDVVVMRPSPPSG